MGELIRGVFPDLQRRKIIYEYEKEAIKLGVDEVAIFAGFYFDSSNARARTDLNNNTFFNSRHIFVPESEICRIFAHELQHVQTQAILTQTEKPYEAWAFVFHSLFIGLHQRMKKHFSFYSDKGYPFRKQFWEIPDDYGHIMARRDKTYGHYEEVLSLLRAYETYQDQIEMGMPVESQPYEFIEAFCLEDLHLLNPEYRSTIALEVIKDRPELFVDFI